MKSNGSILGKKKPHFFISKFHALDITIHSEVRPKNQV